jgi:hypothetical protein
MAITRRRRAGDQSRELLSQRDCDAPRAARIFLNSAKYARVYDARDATRTYGAITFANVLCHVQSFARSCTAAPKL